MSSDRFASAAGSVTSGMELHTEGEKRKKGMEERKGIAEKEMKKELEFGETPKERKINETGRIYDLYNDTVSIIHAKQRLMI